MSWILKQVLPVHQFDVYTIKGSELFVGNDDHAIRHWNLETRNVVSVLKGHKGKITCLEYSEDWKALFSTSIDGRLLVWFGGKLIGEYVNRERRSDCFGVPLFSVLFYPRKDELFVGSTGEILVFKIEWEFIEKSHGKFEVQKFNPVTRIKIHSESIHKMLIAGDKLISVSRDRTIGSTRLDQVSVNKTISLKQNQAISAITYDHVNEILWVGSIDGRLHTMTPDGLILQSESVGNEQAIVSVAVENAVGLIWTVLANGQLRLLDEQNMTIDLSRYFSVLEEKPIIGVDHQKCFAVQYDRRRKIMYGFFNDHYVFQYKYDESAAKMTFHVSAPMRAVSFMEHKETAPEPEKKLHKRPAITPVVQRSAHGALRDGTYILTGCEALEIMCHTNRYQFASMQSLKADATITALAHSPTFIVYGDDAGYVYVVKLSTMQVVKSNLSVKSAITSLHLTRRYIVITTLGGSWHLYTTEWFPEPPDEVSARDMAHNGAINCSAFNPETGVMVTAGSDGMAKTWLVADKPAGMSAKNSQKNMLFLTANSSTMTESNVVDMRKWGEVTFICWALQADRWVTSHSDGQIRVWTTDVLNCQCLVTIPCSVCRVTALAVDDPDVILAALDDKTVRCFSMEHGELLRTMSGHKSTICSVGCGPAFPYYVTGSWDKTVKIWTKVDPAEQRLRPVSSISSVRRERDMSQLRRNKPKTALQPQRPPPTVFQPISIYEKRKQEIERRRRRERAEHEARMRTPVARELKNLQKIIMDML